MNELNLHALPGASVLDALDGSERERFEAHLPDCTECPDEVSTLREAVTAMALGDVTAPTARLKAAVLAEIVRTPQVGPEVAAAAAAAVLIGGVVTGGGVLYRGQQASIRAEATHDRMMRIVSAPDAVSHALDLGAAHVVMSAEMSAAGVMG